MTDSRSCKGVSRLSFVRRTAGMCTRPARRGSRLTYAATVLGITRLVRGRVTMRFQSHSSVQELNGLATTIELAGVLKKLRDSSEAVPTVLQHRQASGDSCEHSTNPRTTLGTRRSWSRCQTVAPLKFPHMATVIFVGPWENTWDTVALASHTPSITLRCLAYRPTFTFSLSS